MNVQLKDITVTARDGRVSHLDQVYIRGSHVRFFIVPDMLKYVFTHGCSRIVSIALDTNSVLGMRPCSVAVTPEVVVWV